MPNAQLNISLFDQSNVSRDWPVNSQGLLLKNITVISPDGIISIRISSGTEMLDPNDNPLHEIHIATAAPPADPPAGYHVLKAFDFNPDGATFHPGMEITISLDLSEVPPDKIVVLAFYNISTGEWELIRDTVNENDTATFNIIHFSVYTLMFRTDKNSLGVGTIVGIAAAIAVVLVLVMLVIKRRRPQKQPVRMKSERRE